MKNTFFKIMFCAICLTLCTTLTLCGVAQAEWLAAPVGDVDPNVVSHDVQIDDGAVVNVPRQLSADGQDVLLWDISGMTTASFKVWAVNDQGRRSDTFAPFDLKARPSVSSGFQIVE